MTTPIVVICPGQGAQALGMGRAWHDASPEARETLEQADAVLADRLGAKLSQICFDGPAEHLNRTDVSQPAIFAVSVASWRGWLAQRGMAENDLPLAGAAGLSLGEYTALHLAGAISFQDALELVALRGRAMQDAAEASPSGMVALVGADEPKAREVCEKALEQARTAHPDAVLVPANFNAPGQVVISGSLQACEAAEGVGQEMGLRTARLPVAGAFHSPLMQPAADALAEALANTVIALPRCPVASNVTGNPHASDAGSIRARLVEQLTSPVRWASCCEWLNESVEGERHELAPGRTLAGLMRRIDRSVKVFTHDEPEASE